MASFVFVSTYVHPTQKSIEAMMRRSFKDFECEHCWVRDLPSPAVYLKNLLHTFADYGHLIAREPKQFKSRFFQTTYLAKRIHALAPTVIRPGKHAFSFQTQSLYDTSVPGVPHFIYTDHTHLSNLSAPGFDRRHLRPKKWIEMERGIYHHARLVFTRSTDVREDLIKLYDVPPEKIVCAYSGSNVRVPDERQLNDARYADQHILFVGQNWERKGGPTLVEAFRRVQRRFPKARLTIVGASPNVRLQNCTVLGKTSLDEVAKLFASASIFCLPTRLEPFGIVFIEAMMYKLPIVATRVGAIPDMVKEGSTGYLVRPDDPESLAEALEKLLSDPERCRTFGAAGREHARTTYTWDNVGRIIRSHILQNI
jgi:glycosyltransferase involved in cell wall biosynthesis